jgi:hypothetical protein
MDRSLPSRWTQLTGESANFLSCCDLLVENVAGAANNLMSSVQTLQQPSSEMYTDV